MMRGMQGPLDRAAFARRFGARAVFGMVHLRALPGSPRWGGSMDRVIDAAVRDAEAIASAGAAGLVIENFGDAPFSKKGDEATIAAMARVAAEILRSTDLPIGINVLRNDPAGALSVAASCAAAFIRVNVHIGAMVTDQGVIEGEAAATLRLRSALAPEVAIFADWMVKHATPLADADPEQSALDLRHRGLADAVVVSGRATGAPVSAERLARLRALLPDAPLVIGSGLTKANARALSAADAAIVGTSVKRGGTPQGPVDRRKVEAVVKAFRG